MAAKEMYDYLSEVTADYTATELDVVPNGVLPEDGRKEQFVHKFSNGQRGIVTMVDDSFFEVTLIFNNMTAAVAGTIMDFWHDTLKANGMARSFYWPHPKEGHTYTVRFLSMLSRAYKVSTPNHIDVKQIKLEILGVKPA